MSVPEVEEQRTKRFYGRSLPRAAVILDENGAVNDKRPTRPLLANAPLIEWASKAPVKQGGALQPMTKNFSPEYAFLGAQLTRAKAKYPDMLPANLLVLARAEAAELWPKLSEGQRLPYIKLADADAIRYKEELAAHEHLRPPKIKHKPSAPKAAFTLFLDEKIREKQEAHPYLETFDRLKLKASLIKELTPVWNQLPEDEKKNYQTLAEEDQKRWEQELDSFPEYKAEIQQKAQLRARKKNAIQPIKKMVKDQKQKRQAAGTTKRAAGKSGAGRKRMLPKANRPIKKAAKKARVGSRSSSRITKAKKAAEIEEEEAGESSDDDSVESVDIGYTDSEDEIISDVESEQEEEPDNKGGAGNVDKIVEAAVTGSQETFTASEKAVAEAMTQIVEEEEALADILQEEEGGIDEAAGTQSQGSQLFTWAVSAVQGLFGRSAKTETRKAAIQPGLELPSQPVVDMHGNDLLGVTFYKEFPGHGIFQGKVVEYSTESDWYLIEYEDGDSEEMTHSELMALLKWNKDAGHEQLAIQEEKPKAQKISSKSKQQGKGDGAKKATGKGDAAKQATGKGDATKKTSRAPAKRAKRTGTR